MWSFSSNTPPLTDLDADGQLELYAFLIAEQYVESVDKTVQDQLIRILYAVGKPPVFNRPPAFKHERP